MDSEAGRRAAATEERMGMDLKRSGGKRRGWTYEKKKSLYGFLFILPWVIGFGTIFLRSLISSLCYSFSNLRITSGKLEMTFMGFSNYVKAFFSDLKFPQYLASQLGSMLYYVPVILVFGLFMAVILNQKFHGRTLVRAIFFIPVIAGSGGIILSIMSGDAMSQSILDGSRSSMLFETTAVQQMLLESGVSQDIVDLFMKIVSGVFDLSWKSGLQIVLFIAGLQTIPSQLYEAAQVEGATAWESFWKITFPMITPMLMVNLIYTIIDNFTDYSNLIMKYILDFGRQLDFSYSATLSWIYFIIVFAIVGIVYAIINRKVVYTVD